MTDGCGDYSPDEIERMRQIADGYKGVVPPIGPRLDWNHTDACNFLMGDPESDTYHASRCLLDQIVALEETERKQLAEVERLRAQVEIEREAFKIRDELRIAEISVELNNELVSLRAENRWLRGDVAKLEAENTKLRAALKMNAADPPFRLGPGREGR